MQQLFWQLVKFILDVQKLFWQVGRFIWEVQNYFGKWENYFGTKRCPQTVWSKKVSHVGSRMTFYMFRCRMLYEKALPRNSITVAIMYNDFAQIAATYKKWIFEQTLNHGQCPVLPLNCTIYIFSPVSPDIPLSRYDSHDSFWSLFGSKPWM